jgi:hypothetical protein
MLEDMRRELESTVTPLLRGILDDTQKLFRQELALAKVEVREDALRARDAVVGLSLGALSGALSFIFTCFSVVYLLITYSPDLPLWGAFAIMAAVLAVVSWFFTIRGARKARQIRGYPQETMGSLHEGFQWMQRRA